MMFTSVNTGSASDALTSLSSFPFISKGMYFLTFQLSEVFFYEAYNR